MLFKASVYGTEIGAKREAMVSHSQAVWLSEQPCVQAVVCETSVNGLKTIYEDGTMRQWDSAGRIRSGQHARFDRHLGWF